MRSYAIRFGLLAIFCAANAQAFRTPSDLPDFAETERIRWASDEIAYYLHESGAPGFNFGDVQATAQSMLDIWGAPACSNVSFRFEGSTPDPAAPGDGTNTIQWLTEGWDSLGFDPDASGLTDVSFEKNDAGDWAIVEADLYVNAEHFDWVLTGEATASKREVASVLLHESGHMLGLLHPCEVDGLNGAPDCAETSEFDDAVMHPLYAAGRYELSADDEGGVCFLYPGAGCAETGCPDGETCFEGACLATCNGGICAAGQLCTSDGCEGPDEPDCTDEECSRTRDCASDAECHDYLTCLEGYCVPGRRADGDPCAEARQCLGGACRDGFCTSRCLNDSECREGGTCERTDLVGDCVSPLGPFGSTCSNADDCLGGRCVAQESSNQGVCTRSCDDEIAVCPLDFVCGDVEGEKVCQRLVLYASGGGGCRVTATKSGSGGLMLALLTGICFLRRRKRRSALVGTDVEMSFGRER